MGFRSSSGIYWNCGQVVSFFADIETDEFPVRVAARCTLCLSQNYFGTWRDPLAWSDRVDSAPKDCVRAMRLPEPEDLPSARSRARGLVHALMSEIRARDTGQALFGGLFGGAEEEAEAESRLVRQVARFIVDSRGAVNPEGISLLIGQLGCLLLWKSGRDPELWDAETWQRYREFMSGFAARLREQIRQRSLGYVRILNLSGGQGAN